ncbi:FeoA family protein [Paenibacillus hexagrammi]|uniref:Ferrous iron transport protein A n=1 Tax=Paenibacillus hexagrammi TaxID=2908839 RepID=A0ABY3SPY5_9BACL|nr:FeoA family protein [Paenibacillus sp. YPD9-1]UJF35749.1 ferrous iron transport protein A [Paenibacillus sp. YPD9-1]
MKLTDTLKGSKVKVIDLSTMSDLVRRRLSDLGIVEGTTVCLCKALPFGGPCTIESKGQCIAIRRKEALCIQVEAL